MLGSTSLQVEAMRAFSLAPERVAHVARWLLIAGWFYLILSLLAPGFAPDLISARLIGDHLGTQYSDHDGPLIFWGLVVPLGVLVIFVLSHELWRRLCPLAFASQLFRALGKQRLVMVKGRPNVAKVLPDSWLAKNHIKLQWSLFIAGLTLRLLVVNGNPIALGLFLLVTVLAAVAVGWAYGGKAWCQYFCPMAPVQSILIGPRSYLGGAAHTDTGIKITQSMCRTVDGHGKEQSACVACQSPCIDIDSERSYWSSLAGKRGLSWAWYSYPGIVLAFFLIMQAQGDGNPSYFLARHWAYDQQVWARIGKPLAFFAPQKPLVPGAPPHAPVLPTPLELQLQDNLRRLGLPEGTMASPPSGRTPLSSAPRHGGARSSGSRVSADRQQEDHTPSPSPSGSLNAPLESPVLPPDFSGSATSRPGSSF
ncbi:hypothetical protein NZK27_10640 [Synechococcus sp. FGCU-3]|nr:hypothetical protein [Synechococcus sp. FGCU3]